MTAFLRALQRTGEVRTSAVDAGVDYTTAYARRKAHPAFAAAWAEAVRRYRAERARAEQEEVAAIRSGLPLAALISGQAGSGRRLGGKGRRQDRREFAISGGQFKRVHAARWNQAAERRFFVTLADKINVRAAADAAGFSTTAIYERRMRHLVFRERWAAVVETGRAQLDIGLVELANQVIQDAIAGVCADPPKMTIAEALQVLKLGAEPRSPTGRDGRRRLNAGAQANLRTADAKEIAEALAKRLVTFRKRMDREEKRGTGPAASGSSGSGSSGADGRD